MALKGWRLRAPSLILGTAGLVACSPVNPTPSSRFDATYAGTWQASDQELCGLSKAHGKAEADIRAGHVTLRFEPHREMDGNVAYDGYLRASGIWRSATQHFAQETIFEGYVANATITGVATNYRCQTQVHLRQVVVVAPAHKATAPARPKTKPKHRQDGQRGGPWGSQWGQY